MNKQNFKDLREFFGFENIAIWLSVLLAGTTFVLLTISLYKHREVEYSNEYLKETLQKAGFEEYSQMRDEESSYCKHNWDEMTCNVVLYPNEKTAVATTIVLEKKLTLVKN